MWTVLGALTFLALLAPAAQAQEDAATQGSLPVDRALLESFYQRSGIKTGLQIREQAARDLTPFSNLNTRPTEVPAIGIDVLYRGRNVLVIRDTDGAIQRAGFNGQSAWNRVTSEVYRLYPDEFHMVMALTTWTDNSAGAAYYLPLANEVRGLGYQHLSGVEVFNQTQSDTLDGLIFMNNYRTYLGQNEVYGRIVFLQEIGHRWGAFVWYGNGPGDGRDMLGRDDAHWSYFMDSQNSGLEGNAWRDNNNGAFTTETDAFTLSFSELDLYLMGFRSANEVDPWFLIRDPEVGNKRDDYGQRLNAASPPAFGGRVTLTGDRWDITIEDVQRAEGQRNPAFENAQREWKVATVLVVGQNASFGDSELRTVENMLDDWEGIFEAETRNVADLDLQLEESSSSNLVGFGEECATSADCDREEATTCIATDEERICSFRCVDAADCGAGYCCAIGFCYPAEDSACEEASNNNPGNNNPGNNNPGNNNPGNNNSGSNNTPGNNGGFIDEDPFLDDNGASGSGSASDGCATAAPTGRLGGSWALGAGLLALVGLALRRR